MPPLNFAASNFVICIISVLVIFCHPVSALATQNTKCLDSRKTTNVGNKVRFWGDDRYQIQMSADGKPVIKDGKVELRGEKTTKFLKYFGRDDPTLYEALNGELRDAYVEYLDWTKLCQIQSLNDEEQQKYGSFDGGSFKCEIKTPVTIDDSVIEEVSPAWGGQGQPFTLFLFQRLEINRTTFLHNVDFSESVFNKEISFDADVRGIASFRTAQFLGSAFFTDSVFSRAYFSGCTFQNGAYYSGAEFKGTSSWDEAIFGGEALFIKTSFTRSTSLRMRNSITRCRFLT